MKIHKGYLIGIATGVFLLHGGLFYLCQNMTIRSLSIPSRKHPYALTYDLEKLKRNQQLAEIFQHLTEVKEEAKPEFPDLKAEMLSLPTSVLTLDQLKEMPPLCSELSFKTVDSLPLDLNGDLLVYKVSNTSDHFFENLENFQLTPPQLEGCFDQNAYEELGALASSDHFTMTVEYASRSYRPGYVFKILLQAKNSIPFKRIRQNYFFLIDRSNSIPRARYFLNKQAVSEVLGCLMPGDTFNILVFDDRVERFSEACVPWNEETVEKARLFLDRQNHGGHFAATELYASLGKIIPQNVSNEEINTAILLSDGDTYLTLEKQRQTIGGWTSSNNGKVSLFCVASGTGNNLPLLDLISTFNKGTLLYVPQHDQMAGRMKQLIQSIQYPIGKNIVATSVTPDKQMSINLQPKSVRLPHLYQNRPFVIWGSTNRLGDFTLFLQGKYYDKVFNIKKTVSFKEVQSGTLNLERQWTQCLAHEYFERFFKDGKLSHLEAAKQLLVPLNIPVPFLPN